MATIAERERAIKREAEQTRKYGEQRTATGLCGEAAPPVRPLQLAANRLAQELVALDCEIGKLTEALQPVLQPRPDEPQYGQGCESRPPISPFTNGLENMAIQVFVIRRKLQTLLELLDL